MLKQLPPSTLIAGVLTIAVGYTGPFLIIVHAAQQAGLSPAELASWMWAVSFGSGIAGLWLSGSGVLCNTELDAGGASAVSKILRHLHLADVARCATARSQPLYSMQSHTFYFTCNRKLLILLTLPIRTVF